MRLLPWQHRYGRCLFASALILALVNSAAMAQAQPPAGEQTPRADTPAPAAQRNVYRAGGQVRPPAAVQGDFTAAGGRVIVDQPVSGDAAIVGGAVDVRAAVGDDVRAAGGDVNIESSVGGELFASGGNVIVTSAASVGKGARLYGAEITMDGRVQGPLQAAGQRIVINGQVHGDTRLTGEQIEFGPAARIDGALSYSSRAPLKRAESAVVTGVITREEGAAAERRTEPADKQGAAWGGTVFIFLVTLLSAAVLIALAPGFAGTTAERIKASPGASLGLGFLIALAVPLIALLLFITILGIPLALLVMALFPALWLVGFLIAAVFVARQIPGLMKKPAPASYGATMGYVALALLIILLLANVPVVGGFFVVLLSLAGMGACVLAFRRRKPPPLQTEAQFPIS